MSDKKYVSGSGGGPDEPPAQVNTPDTLFSEDVVEFALAISEGPIRGLKEGAKSFYVGDTALLDTNGNKNFDKFAIGVHPGFPEGVASPLKLQLGGETSNSVVNVSLLQDVSVVRQTSAILRNTIDELEVRLQIQRLVTTNDQGTFTNNAKFRLEYKKETDVNWSPFSGSATTKLKVEAYWYSEIIGYDTGSGEPGVPIYGNTELRYVSDDTPVPAQYAAQDPGSPWVSHYGGDPGSVQLWRDVVTPDGEIHVSGKTSNGVVKEFRVKVPRINEDWMIRVTKLNPQTSTSEYCDIAWESFQCTSLVPRTYPNTAVVHGLGVSNGQFSSIPTFSGIWDGLLVRVPTNYNPDTRTYDDTFPWDGSLKFAWTNNPAWILYDQVVNTRYGLAAHYRYVDCNRFDFYEAARWCDTQVQSLINPANFEPRFTYNDVIAEPRDAKEMLSYVAGSFNALIWDDLTGKIHLRVDRDDPAIALFTPENITDDGFNYTFTDLSTRVNDISVAFINPDLDWNEDVRRIPGVTTDEDAILRDGRIPLDFIAVGCTSVSEAVRKARYRLLSAQTETKIVSFTTTRLGALLSLYDVILIADPTMGWSISGRITHFDSGFMYLRDPIYIEQLVDYTVKFQTALGIIELTVTAEQLGNVNRFAFEIGQAPTYLPKNATFTIERVGSFGVAKPFRVMSLEDVEGSPYMFQISALELNRSKYTASETGEAVPEIQYSYKTINFAPPPQEVKISSGDDLIEIAPNGTASYRMRVSWQIPRGAVVDRFEAEWANIEDSIWNSVPATSILSFYIDGGSPGVIYTARVRSIDPYGNKSPWVYSPNHLNLGSIVVPTNVVSFGATGELFLNKLNWVFDNKPTTKLVEIWYSLTAVFAEGGLLTSLLHPTTHFTHLALNANVTVYYWIRILNINGNYSLWSAPISATTSNDPAKIVGMLAGKIAQSHLEQTLSEGIDGLVINQDKLSNEYTVKISQDGYVTGFGIALEPDVGQNPVSTFLVKADRFAVGFPGEVGKYPFVIGNVGGSPVVGINGALVVDGSIAAQSVDTRGLSIKDAEGNVILAAGTALDFDKVGGSTKPANNATVGATWGGNIASQPTDQQVMNVAASFTAAKTWEFQNSADGWTCVNWAPTNQTDSLRLTATALDPTLSINGISIDGRLYDKVRIRLRRVSGTAPWEGYFFYETAGHGWDILYHKLISNANTLTDWHVLEYDMAALTAGGTDWTSNTITGLRLDITQNPSGDVWEIDWIAVGKYGAANNITNTNQVVDGANLGGTAIWATVTGANKPADNASSDVTLVGTANMTVSGNKITKSSGSSGWDSAAYSRDSYTGGAFASAIAPTTASAMFGLNTDASADAGFAGIDYAWHFMVNNFATVWESGAQQVSVNETYIPDVTVLAVTYDGVNVRYLKDGVVVRTVAAAANLKFFFDSTISEVNHSLSNIRFGPLTNNDWSVIGGANKPADNATVGADSSNLAIGVGGNLIANSDFDAGLDPWIVNWVQSGGTNYAFSNYTDVNWIPAGGHAMGVVRWGDALTGVIDLTCKQKIPVMPGQRYELSAYIAAHRCDAYPEVGWYKLVGGVETYITETPFAGTRLSGGQTLTNWARMGGFVTAPADAQYAYIWMRVTPVDGGQVDGYTWGTRFFFAEALAGQTELSPWSKGGAIGAFSNLNKIDASNASTYIANAAIGQLQVDLASANKLIVGQANIATAAVGQLQVDLASANKLVVGMANIGDAQVDTLQIAGNAVTIPSGFSGSTGFVTRAGSWLTAATFTISSSGAPTAFIAQLKLNATGGNETTELNRAFLRLLDPSGVELDQCSVVAASGASTVNSAGMTIVKMATPGTGSKTWTLQYYGEFNVLNHQAVWEVAILETKR